MKKLMGSILLIVVLMSFQTITKSTKSAVKKTTVPVATAKASLERGKTVYLQRCLACHQADGGGVPHLNAPLDRATAVVGKDKAKIIRIVLKGLTDRAEIDGETYNNNMAPNSDLKDQQIADVLTYIRNTWSNKATPVTAAEVKMVRARTK